MSFRAFVGAVALFCLPLAPALARHASAQEIVPDQILVRWAAQPAPLVLARGQNAAPWQQSDLRYQLSKKVYGARISRHFKVGWSLVRLPSNVSYAVASARLKTALGAANIAPNSIRHATRVPNDPYYASQQWQWPQIKAPDAWNVRTSASSEVVAVIDSGVDLTHPDLKNNLWKNPQEIAGNGKDDDGNGYIDDVYGIDTTTTDKSAPPQDDFGHGTHCAGLIGAVGSNRIGVTGVAWNVKIMALKFLDATGRGDDANAIRCLQYVQDMKARGVNVRVISNSWGGDDDDPALKAAFQRAEKAGILSVCAAGNGGAHYTGLDTDIRPSYPSAYTLNSIVSVAASNKDDNRASFSNYGLKSVDLAAPGTSIYSLLPDGSYGDESGTSMAAPIVAGAAALLWAQEPTLLPVAVKTRLIQTVDPIDSWKGHSVSGGRLNLWRALTNATLTISGVVYRLNGNTKIALAGALIKVGGKMVTSTDQSGKYKLTSIAPGTYSITAALSGYSFSTVSLAMPRPRGESGWPNAILNFPSTKVPSALYNLSGVATNSAGAVQSGVSIFLSGIPNAVALTDSQGKYLIRDRAAGTYKLSAQSDDGADWNPSAASIALPQKNGTTGAPNGIVNFSVGATDADKDAPQVTITSPADGSTLTTNATKATGTATDASGVSQINFQLTASNSDASIYCFYNWVSHKWTTDYVVGTLKVSGTAPNWSQPLPSQTDFLSSHPNIKFSFRAWGTDVLGHSSDSKGDDETTWEVRTSTASSLSASSSPTLPTPAPLPTPVPTPKKPSSSSS